MTSSVAHFFWIQKYEKGVHNWRVINWRKKWSVRLFRQVNVKFSHKESAFWHQEFGDPSDTLSLTNLRHLESSSLRSEYSSAEQRSSNNCLRPVVVLNSKGQARESLSSQHEGICPSKVLSSNEFFELMYHTHLFLYEDRWVSICNICSTHCILQSVISSSGPLGVSCLWFFHR